MTNNVPLDLATPKLVIPTVYREESRQGVGDATGAFTYVFTKELALAINVALATRRPLLLRGAPGSGKSSLARAVAGVAKRSFVSKVITSDTKHDDLLSTYDYVRRLQDASKPNRELAEDFEYVEPQVLFWALAPKAAEGRGAAGRTLSRKPTPPGGRPPVTTTPAVVLLDEIDKADPSLPNDLLVTLGEGRFTIRETGESVEVEADRDPFIVITTNEERELSRAFVRRCVVAELPELAGDDLKQWLIAVGTAHFRSGFAHDKELVAQLASVVVDSARTTDPPSAAEFVDLVRACHELQIDSKHPTFGHLRQLVADKTRLTRD
jgi:MoxR-like ATPase